MINIIWMAFIIIGLLVAAVTGRIEATTQAAFDGARSAVELCFALIGIYSLWLGLMKVAEKSGLVNALSKRMRGPLGILFPDLPSSSPAMGADRKSTRLNSSHVRISYAVFCLKKKKNNKI